MKADMAMGFCIIMSVPRSSTCEFSSTILLNDGDTCTMVVMMVVMVMVMIITMMVVVVMVKAIVTTVMIIPQ